MLHHRTLWVVAIRNGLRLWRLSRNLIPEIHDLSFLPFVLHVYIPYCSHHTQDNCSRSNHSYSLQNSPHLHCSDLNSKIQSCNMSYCIHKLCPMNDSPRKHLTSFETWFITDLTQSVPHSLNWWLYSTGLFQIV